MAEVDLLIVGGGPAGMAAARVAAAHGLAVTIVDEQQRPGGQILRQPPAAFSVERWMTGATYRAVRAELAAFEQTMGIDWLGGRSVLGLERDGSGFVVHAAGPNDVRRVHSPRVLVASGCYDLPVPLPGWTLPGVMAAGGVQAFIKSQAFVPGTRFVLAGTHPLLLIVAAQIVTAGGEVALVAFDQPIARAFRILLGNAFVALRHGAVFAAAAEALRILRRHKIKIRHGLPLRAVVGAGRAEVARFDGLEVAADAVALCYGFVPQSDLPRMAGAAVEWASPAGGWRTRHDRWMRTDIAGLSVAGETSGVAGADVALDEGRLAALGFVASGEPQGTPAEAAPIRRRLDRQRAFTALLADLADPQAMLDRVVPPETILCRCEDVRHHAITAVLAESPHPNAIKLATRCGMGLCQGRSCEAALLRLIARYQGTAPGVVEGFTARFPIRPVRIGDLIAPADVANIATISNSRCD